MIKNLTPHALVLVDNSGVKHTLQPENLSARVAVTEKIHGFLQDINMTIIYQEFKDVENLPDYVPGTVLIVSAMVLSQLPLSRRGFDVFAPDTGKTAIRDEKGNIIAVTRLSAGEQE